MNYDRQGYGFPLLDIHIPEVVCDSNNNDRVNPIINSRFAF